MRRRYCQSRQGERFSQPHLEFDHTGHWALADVERRRRVQKSRVTISRAAYARHRRPPARTQGGTG